MESIFITQKNLYMNSNSEKPIFLTTKRLMYNMARVDLRYGRVSEEYVEQRKKIWEDEYNDPNYVDKHKKKYD